MTVKIYGPDTDFGYVRTLTLTIADMTLVALTSFMRYFILVCRVDFIVTTFTQAGQNS